MLAFKNKLLQEETTETAIHILTKLRKLNKRVFPQHHGRRRATQPCEKDVLRIHACVMQLTNRMFDDYSGKGEDAITSREHIQRFAGMSAPELFAPYMHNVEKYITLFEAHGLGIPQILQTQ